MSEGRWPAAMTKELACEYLSISERTLDRMMADGDIRPVKIRGNMIRFRRIELDQFLEDLPHGDRPQDIAARQAPQAGKRTHKLTRQEAQA